MPRSTKRQTGSFVAQDELGRNHTIYVFAEFWDLGSGEEKLGRKNFVTESAHPVEIQEDEGPGVYRDLITDAILKTSDPDAQEA